jgi:N-acyl-D-amino-acid deacylase
MTLPEAIRKMTSMPAARLGLDDRGVVRPGMKADLVLFDPNTVTDRSTFEDPRALSAGIAKVWVNGGLVWTGGAPGAERPGRVLSRH